MLISGWGDPEGALEAYNRPKDGLHAGREPREVSPTGVDLRHLCNDFWNTKSSLVEAGELSPMTMRDYTRTCDLVAEAFGRGRLVEDIGPDDFTELRKAVVWMTSGLLRKRWRLCKRSKAVPLASASAGQLLGFD